MVLIPNREPRNSSKLLMFGVVKKVLREGKLKLMVVLVRLMKKVKKRKMVAR